MGEATLGFEGKRVVFKEGGSSDEEGGGLDSDGSDRKVVFLCKSVHPFIHHNPYVCLSLYYSSYACIHPPIHGYVSSSVRLHALIPMHTCG